MAANVQITQVLLKRGNTARSQNYTGVRSEVTHDTGIAGNGPHTLRIHDGQTPGGTVIASQNWVNQTIANAALGNVNLSSYATITYVNNAVANVSGNYGNTNVKSYLSSFNGNIVPSANSVYSLGSATQQWKDLWVSNATIYLNSIPLGLDTAGNLTFDGNPLVSYINGNLSVGDTNISVNSIDTASVVNGELIINLADGTILNAGNVVGPQGETGPQGPEGPQGIQGNIGPQGTPGPKGDKGDTGDQGPHGEQGIQGNVGPTGPQGIQGNVGPRGEQGIQGIQGNTGPTGPQGIQGNIGPQGPQGIQGVKGDRGDQGISVTLVGNVALPGDLPGSGNAGEAYIVTSTGNLYFWNTSISSWADIGPIVGPRGDKGDTGEQGVPGEPGPQGETGPQGPEGPQGPQGEQGVPGEPGPQGETGPKGDTGDQGPQGPKGDKGDPGDPSIVTISEINTAGNITNEVVGISAIRFDRDTGFNVTDLGSGEVKVSLGSSWKTWLVDGQDPLIAQGEDTVTFVAGNNMVISTNAAAKTITFDSTGGSANTGIIAFETATAEAGIYNSQGGGVVISNFSYWNEEAETAFIQIPPGNSSNDLRIIQEQGNVVVASTNQVWTFATDGTLTAPYGKLGVTTGEIFGIVADADTAATVQSSNGAYVWGFGIDGVLNLPESSSENIAIIQSDQSIQIISNNKYWSFASDGVLTLPENGDIVNINGTSVLGGSGGNPFDQDLNTTNSVTFANVATTNLNFGQVTIGAPQPFGTTDRITLFDFDGSNDLSGFYNYAIGVEPDHVWFANDYATDAGGFKFYGRGNLAAKIGSAGTITLGENSTGIFWSNGAPYSAGGSGGNSDRLVNGNKEAVLDENGNLDMPDGGQIWFSYGYIDQDEGEDSNALRVSGGNGVTIKAGEDTSTWRFNNDGSITFPDATVQTTAWTGVVADIGNTAPALSNGTLWFNTEEARMYIKYNDQWVDSSPTVLAPPDTNPAVESVTFNDNTTQTTAWTGTVSYNDLTDKPVTPAFVGGGGASTWLTPD